MFFTQSAIDLCSMSRNHAAGWVIFLKVIELKLQRHGQSIHAAMRMFCTPCMRLQSLYALPAYAVHLARGMYGLCVALHASNKLNFKSSKLLASIFGLLLL